MSSSPQRFLLIGGTGKVGRRIAHQLVTAAGAPPESVLVATRGSARAEHGTPVRFDWDDESTWAAALRGGPAVYITPPFSADPVARMRELVDAARRAGSRRFVLLSGSPLELGGPNQGQVHAYLKELGDRGEVEWTALRPTWFQQNFKEVPMYSDALKRERKIYSATGEGKIPWVSTEDIAAVAVVALTRKEPLNSDPLILGPELLSWDDIATILTEISGNKVEHVKLTPAQLQARHESFGIPSSHAQGLAQMDKAIQDGAENRLNDVVQSLTGRAPRAFRPWAEANKAAWL